MPSSHSHPSLLRWSLLSFLFRLYKFSLSRNCLPLHIFLLLLVHFSFLFAPFEAVTFAFKLSDFPAFTVFSGNRYFLYFRRWRRRFVWKFTHRDFKWGFLISNECRNCRRAVRFCSYRHFSTFIRAVINPTGQKAFFPLNLYDWWIRGYPYDRRCRKTVSENPGINIYFYINICPHRTLAGKKVWIKCHFINLAFHAN